MPDIDTDMDGEGKDLVVEHLRQKWGRYNVAAVGTITKSAAGSALADSFRVHNLSYRRSVEISKKYFKTVRGVPPKISKLLEDTKSEFYKFVHSDSCDEDERTAIYHAAQYIEARERQAGVHAGGVAISSELFDYVPLTWDGKESKITTAYDKDELEEMGVIKFDILGLNNLAQELEIERLLQENNLPVPQIYELGNYPEIYSMLRQGDTFGVFQMSEQVATNLLKEIEANCFEDLSAVNALNRPGPLDSGSDRVYVRNRKNGTPSIHPVVDRLLTDTYGIMLYQEQIMFIAKELCGYTAGEADELRKIIGKKKVSEMPKQESKFVGGAINNGVSEELALSLWNEVKAAGEYSFNKSHTYAYGYQAIISAFYKVYCPIFFWAAGITVNNSHFEKSAEWIAQARKHFLIFLPTINSFRVKTWVSQRGIELGLANVKGIGIKVAQTVMDNAPYTGILDFILRSGLDKGTILSLNKLNFFTAVFPEPEFEHLFKLYGDFKGMIKRRATKNNAEYVIVESEFREYLQQKEYYFPEPCTPTLAEIVANEKDLLGTVISVSPFAQYESLINYFQNPYLESDYVVGVVQGFKPHTTKKGQLMAFLSVQDNLGRLHDITVFNQELNFYNLTIQESIQKYEPLIFEVSRDEWNGKQSNKLKTVLRLENVLEHWAEFDKTPYYNPSPYIVTGTIIGNRTIQTKMGTIDSSLKILTRAGDIKEVYVRQGCEGKAEFDNFIGLEIGTCVYIEIDPQTQGASKIHPLSWIALAV